MTGQCIVCRLEFGLTNGLVNPHPSAVEKCADPCRGSMHYPVREDSGTSEKRYGPPNKHASIQKRPLPPRGGRPARWPIGQMEVGDCIVVDTLGEVESLRTCAIQWAKYNDPERKFVRRKIPGEGFGVWRVA